MKQYSEAYDLALKAQKYYKQHNNDQSDNGIQNMINTCKTQLKKQDETLALKFKNADFG